jgi:REP element-mobilizing transposase RayT
MAYYQLYYHLVWRFANEEPLLTATAEPPILDYVRWRAVGLGAAVFALAGTADHVHLVATIPPRIAVAAFVDQVRRSAATRFNKRTPETTLRWAEAYGALTFDGKRLPYVIAYVEQQKAHHAAGTTIPVLERVDDRPIAPGTLREPPAAYTAEAGLAAWWAEMMALG